MEVLVEQSEFPELVGDVLADIGDCAVGSHDDLVVVVALGIDPHHPAAFVLAFGLKEDRVAGLELFERVVPELQMQDVAFARKQIVADADALHRGEMAVDDRHRDECRHFRGLVSVFFDLLQRFRAKGVFRDLRLRRTS